MIKFQYNLREKDNFIFFSHCVLRNFHVDNRVAAFNLLSFFNYIILIFATIMNNIHPKNLLNVPNIRYSTCRINEMNDGSLNGGIKLHFDFLEKVLVKNGVKVEDRVEEFVTRFTFSKRAKLILPITTKANGKKRTKIWTDAAILR